MRRAWTLTMLALLGGWFAITASPLATAQDQPATIDFVIRVLTCDQMPARGPGMASEDPEGCVRLDGVAISVATDTGQSVASCITGQTRPGWGDCVIQAPYDGYVVVTQDVTTLPAGYAPRVNPRRARAYTEFAGVIFVNLPTGPASVTSPRPTSLPNTGSGSTTREPGPRSLGIAAVVVTTAAIIRCVTGRTRASVTA